MLAILDYKAGNQTSVERALKHLDIPCEITDDTASLERAEGIIFPGVGSAPQAMGRLQSTGLDAVLRRAVDKGQPLLGICLGCQILLEESEEGNIAALGLLKGKCRKFNDKLREENGEPLKVPHMGWNGIRQIKASPLFEGIPQDAEFYFVHSYYVEPPEELVLATTRYGHAFCSVYGRDGLWAVQFHLEKSGEPGLAMLANFASWCRERGHAV